MATSPPRHLESGVDPGNEVGVMAPRGLFFLVRCVVVLLATVKICQRKLVNSFTPANKTKLVRENLSFIHMSNEPCPCSCVTGFNQRVELNQKPIIRVETCNPGGGGILPYMGYIGMCRCEG